MFLQESMERSGRVREGEGGQREVKVHVPLVIIVSLYHSIPSKPQWALKHNLQF